MRLPVATLGLLLALNFQRLLAQAVPPIQATGPGDLLVAPTRVVFDLRKRTAELNLSNIGSVAATYRISLVRMEMDEEGGITEKPFDKTPGAVDLKGLIRFSPREVVLGPGDSQTLRLQVRKPAELPVGEYRINVVFQGVPPPPDPPKEPGSTAPPKGISIRLIPVYGLSIPLIVRHGETSAKVDLSDLAFDRVSRSLSFRLGRQGNRSVYGDLNATWSPRSGKAETLAEATGVAVYVPNVSRKMVLVLANPKGATTFGAGRLKITYALPSVEGGALLAEAFLDLP